QTPSGNTAAAASAAATAPTSWARMYTSALRPVILPAAAHARLTAGLTCPPETGRKAETAVAKATPWTAATPAGPRSPPVHWLTMTAAAPANTELNVPAASAAASWAALYLTSTALPPRGSSGTTPSAQEPGRSCTRPDVRAPAAASTPCRRCAGAPVRKPGRPALRAPPRPGLRLRPPPGLAPRVPDGRREPRPPA